MNKNEKISGAVGDHPVVRIPINFLEGPFAENVLPKLRAVMPELESDVLWRLTLFKVWLAFGRAKGRGTSIRVGVDGTEMLEHFVGWQGEKGELIRLLKSVHLLRPGGAGRLSLFLFRMYNFEDLIKQVGAGNEDYSRCGDGSIWVPTDLLNWRSSYLLVETLLSIDRSWNRERAEWLLCSLWLFFSDFNDGMFLETEEMTKRMEDSLGWEGEAGSLIAILKKAEILRSLPDSKTLVLRGFTALNAGQTRKIRPSNCGVDEFRWGELSFDEMRRSKSLQNYPDFLRDLLGLGPSLSPFLEGRFQMILRKKFNKKPVSLLTFAKKAHEAIIETCDCNRDDGGLQAVAKGGDMTILGNRSTILLEKIEELK